MKLRWLNSETDLYVIFLSDNYQWLTPLTMEPAWKNNPFTHTKHNGAGFNTFHRGKEIKALC